MNQMTLFTESKWPQSESLSLSRREREVYECLKNASDKRIEYWDDLPGRVPPHIFSTPQCGGGEGKRRLRELRAKLNQIGIDIKHSFVEVNGKKTTNTVYWLTRLEN